MKYRHILSGLILMAIASLWFGTAAAHAQKLRPLSAAQQERLERLLGTEKGPVVTYDYDAQPVRLRQNLRKVAVELTDYNKNVPLRANRALRSLTSLQHAKNGTRDYVRSRFIMEWADGSTPSAAEWKTRASDLTRNSSVRAAWPVFVYEPTGIDVYCAGEVSVKLNGNGTTETLSLIAAKENLYLVDSAPSAVNTVVLRMKDPSYSDPFTLARKLATHTEIASWASPNLTQSYKLYSNWVPWPGIPPTEAFAGTDPMRSSQWHLNLAGFSDLFNEMKYMDWPPLLGDNGYFPTYHFTRIPTVGIVDTGVDYAHEDLWPNTWRSWNEYQNVLKPEDGIDNDFNGYVDDVLGWDFYGNSNNPFGLDPHGTACAGIAAARGYNNIGVRGGSPFLAPMAIKVAEVDPGSGITTFADDAKLAQALTYAGMMCDVVSNSWGGGAPSNAIHEAIMYCRTFGRLGHWVTWNGSRDLYMPLWRGSGSPVLFAAGNDYNNALAYPGADIWSIAVGATDRQDRRTSYSNLGEGLDLVAPAGAVTTDITGAPGYSPSNYTDQFSGTSSATPLAASVVLSTLAHNYRQFSQSYTMSQRFTDVEYVLDPVTNRLVETHNYLADPNDRINRFIDPRHYLVGELTLALLRGTDKVNTAHGNYDSRGYSYHYGWGRLNAKKAFDIIRTDVDDVYKVNFTNPIDPSTIYNTKYLRPGRTKWLLARDTDYFLVPMAAGSSARVTVTYLRHARNTQNTVKPEAVRQRFGPFADETTTPRLKVSWWPELDPYWPVDPINHKAEYDGKGQPIHPMNTVIANENDNNRLEDRIVTTLYYESPKKLNQDLSINWEESIPNRPLRNQDTAYYMMVSPVRQYINPRVSGSDTTKTYSPLVEYHIDFEYWPAPAPHLSGGSQTMPNGTVVEGGQYGDDSYFNMITTTNGYTLDSGSAGFQNGNTRYYEDNLPGGKVPVLATGTTLKSVSYTSEQQYGYPAFHEPLHTSDPYRAPNSIHQFPANENSIYNIMVTFDAAQSNIGVEVLDSFSLAVDYSWHETAPVEAIWDVKPARRGRYTLAYGTWRAGGPNNNFVGVHYSAVEAKFNSQTGKFTPVEFTQDKVIQAGDVKLHQLDLSYYPFEHLNSDNGYEKKYLLKTGDKEAARVTIVQDRHDLSSQNYFIWLYATDKAGLGAGRSEDFDIGRSLYFYPMDKWTTYTVTAYVVAKTEELAQNPPDDIRFMLAVDRKKLPQEYAPKAPYAKPKGVPDLSVKSFKLNNSNLTFYGNAEGLEITSLVARNIGTAEVTTYTTRLVDTNGMDLQTTLSPPLQPGQETVDFPAGTGLPLAVYPARGDGLTTYILALQLDPENRHFELREDNNLTTIGLRVFAAKADPTVAGPVLVSPKPVGAGAPFSLGFTFKNVSPFDMTGQCTLKIINTSDKNKELFNSQIPIQLTGNQEFPIPLGQINLGTTPATALGYGKHVLRIEISGGGDVNPSNNSMTYTLDVQKGSAEDWSEYR